jgi:hypothetical protein
VRDIDRFFRRGYKKNKSRITAIFIIDAIVKAEQKAFDNKKLKFAKRFATVLPHMFEGNFFQKSSFCNPETANVNFSKNDLENFLKLNFNVF